MAKKALHHRTVIIGGGTAGITVAARLKRSGESDIAIIEPSEVHYYQPLWTVVGGGLAKASETVRSEASVMPRGVKWIRDAAVTIDPENHIVTTETDTKVGYDYLVVCPGIQLDWNRVPGLADTLGKNGVSSNYTFDLAPKTWEFISNMKSGTAVFTMPSGPIKCAGAPQKIAYLAADWWRRQGVLSNIKVILVLPTPGMFGVPEFAKVLEQVVERYGIDVRFQSEMVEIDPSKKEVVISDNKEGSKYTIGYDFLHAVPPQSAPDWIKHSPISDGTPAGYVEVGKHSMQHPKYPNVFAIGDAGSTPNSKTGAAIRKQAPVLVSNLRAVMNNRAPDAEYDGYASCPLVTARNRMLLAEFDYTLKPHPTIPVIDTKKERYDMWLLKRYGLPFMYWNLMLKGLA
jgi:sulfide:quinone oxidoreductase